jgi:hypothetical protein
MIDGMLAITGKWYKKKQHGVKREVGGLGSRQQGIK